ncbi:hypothetical protein ACHAXR_000458, partial [Thalassiosira sp. AJA248-18]
FFRLSLILSPLLLGLNGSTAPLRADANASFVNSFPGSSNPSRRQVLEQKKELPVGVALNAAKPRSGFAQQLLDVALASPIWEYVLVPQARASIVKTAEENGIPWVAAKEWLKSQTGTPWKNDNDYDNIQYPQYYKKAFHAYSDGNLSYDAAFEQELASRAIGARNFPAYSSRGEDVFRGAFDQALSKLGAGLVANNSNSQEEVVIVDFGCGTGTSTRRLAKQYPQATQLIGFDLSPYFIDVGQTLLKLAPSAMDVADKEDNNDENKKSSHGWITAIDSDTRIELRQGDMTNT